MPKKPKRGKPKRKESELWVAPKYNMKGPSGERAWDQRAGGPPSHSRFLELADIALGTKKPTPQKIKSSVLHELRKDEPYLKG